MQKQSIQYDSPLDPLVAVAKRLSRYETEAGLSSEDFFNRFSQGAWRDDVQAIEWANDYRHDLALRAELGKILEAAA
ncbi:hypothetical protein SAMN05421644_1293 [Allochromatium warmingii]|uniref:Uncharacterized protein n=1 Tax=Allochromatium warmingii TaxID=61595 RepID=A0A1H3H1J4_ALLWA|nr:hypothetical protein [Allochromatium warmingii]SDY09331.1 hypothetical protein SAMN05421644_1293 [Allochromatium warmingii]